VGVLAPAGVRRDIVSKVNAALVKVVNTAKIKDAFSKQGLEAQTTTPEQYATFISGQLDQNATLIHAINLRLK
jgi:tripartite-type tricarboxylate transporter receptor subunit TctC